MSQNGNYRVTVRPSSDEGQERPDSALAWEVRAEPGPDTRLVLRLARTADSAEPETVEVLMARLFSDRWMDRSRVLNDLAFDRSGWIGRRFHLEAPAGSAMPWAVHGLIWSRADRSFSWDHVNQHLDTVAALLASRGGSGG